jgi:hypothetical protein
MRLCFDDALDFLAVFSFVIIDVLIPHIKLAKPDLILHGGRAKGADFVRVGILREVWKIHGANDEIMQIGGACVNQLVRIICPGGHATTVPAETESSSLPNLIVPSPPMM